MDAWRVNFNTLQHRQAERVMNRIDHCAGKVDALKRAQSGIWEDFDDVPGYGVLADVPNRPDFEFR